MIANGIMIEQVFFVALLALLAAGVECLVGWPIMGIHPSKTFWLWYVANVVSAFAGFIVLIVQSVWYPTSWSAVGGSVNATPSNMATTLGWIAAYFVETVFVEWLVWLRMVQFRPQLRVRRLLPGVLLANVATYIPIALLVCLT